MNKASRVLVTGGAGMVGSAALRLLANRGFHNVLRPSRDELDLLNQKRVDEYFATSRPEHVLMIAAKVGGIGANVTDPVGFLVENVKTETNVFEACRKYGTKKNLFLGSSCIYPRDCPQPMKEEYLLTGPLEPTNEGYALAKIVGLKLAEYYHSEYGMLTVCPMPCNIYGTGDHFDLGRSHVLSAAVKRIVDAQDEGRDFVEMWGTGAPRREFIHVDDVAEALLFLMDHHDSPRIVNVGAGEDITIGDLYRLTAELVGFSGEIRHNTTKPDGMPRKCLDVSQLAKMGFRTSVLLKDGLARTIEEYRALKARGAIR